MVGVVVVLINVEGVCASKSLPAASVASTAAIMVGRIRTVRAAFCCSTGAQWDGRGSRCK